MKLILKALALAVLLSLKIFSAVVNLLVKLSTYVLGPLMLFIAVCAVYSLVKTNWTSAAILAVMDAVIFAAVFAAGWVTCIADDACDGLTAFLHS